MNRKTPTTVWLAQAIDRALDGESISVDELARELPRVQHLVQITERRADQMAAGDASAFGDRIRQLEKEIDTLKRQLHITGVKFWPHQVIENVEGETPLITENKNSESKLYCEKHISNNNGY